MTAALYTKPYLSVEEQVELLRARGMGISDTGRAEACLHRIGYYRLSGYAYPFRQGEIVTHTDGTVEERLSESFRGGISLSGVMDLYVFDKRLRLLFMDAIERVEIALRVEVALLLGRRGAFAHRSPESFNRYFSGIDATGKSPHARFLEKLDDGAARSKEDFAEHFRNKYDSPLPLWMAIELWDFGTLATVLDGMLEQDRAAMATQFGLARNNYLPSWAKSINFVRNVCAHHGRLWNRPLVQQPKSPSADPSGLLRHLVLDPHAQRRLYAAAAVLRFLLRTINPATSWSARLQEHMASFPSLPGLSIRHMGFSEGWQQLALWKD